MQDALGNIFALKTLKNSIFSKTNLFIRDRLKQKYETIEF